MQPVKIRRNGMESIYADGAVLVNYPISCFDGNIYSRYSVKCNIKLIHHKPTSVLQTTVPQ